jgi:hypothetical protein
LVKLVDGRGNLEPGLEDGLLPLKPDVLGPFNKSREIPLRLNGLPNTEVPSAFLEEGVDDSLDLGFLDGQRRGRNLLALLLSLNKVNVQYTENRITKITNDQILPYFSEPFWRRDVKICKESVETFLTQPSL